MGRGLNKLSKAEETAGRAAETAVILALLLALATGCGGDSGKGQAELGSERTHVSGPGAADLALNVDELSPEDLTATGKAGQFPDASGNFAPGAPTQAELEAKLMSELERLGIDPSKAVSKAPSGADNAVFDLESYPIPARRVILRWTERNVGDYDGNGEVAISDLTPLGQYFGQSPEYLPPEDARGFSNWPKYHWLYENAQWSPNWQLARVDGDGNGIVNISDIVPIAQHFGSQVDGYRVYLRRSGETEFTLLPNSDSPDQPYTVSKLVFDESGIVELGNSGYGLWGDNRVPIYGLMLQMAPNEVVEVYVAPFSLEAGMEGKASDVLTIVPNAPPVLVAEVTTLDDFSPTVLNVDMSGSSDPEGSELEYWLAVNDGSFSKLDGPVHSQLLTKSGEVTIRLRLSDGHASAEQSYSFALPFIGSRNEGWTFSELPGSKTAFRFERDRSLSLISGSPAVVFGGSESGNAAMFFARSADPLGSAWDSPVVAAASGYVPAAELAEWKGQPVVAYSDYASYNSKVFYVASHDSGQSFGAPEEVSKSISLSIGLAIFEAGPTVACGSRKWGDALFRRTGSDAQPEWLELKQPTDGIGYWTWMVNADGRAAMLTQDAEETALLISSPQLDSWTQRIVVPAFEFDDNDLAVNGTLVSISTEADDHSSISCFQIDTADPVAQFSSSEDITAPPLRGMERHSAAFVSGRPVISYYVEPTGELCIAVATDESASSWLAPEAVDSTGNANGHAPLIDMDGHPALIYYDREAKCLIFARCGSPL